MIGRPDIAYTRWKVAVFVDGGFWHGHPQVFQFGTKGAYWDQKIMQISNATRELTARLRADEWEVLRFWEIEVLGYPTQAVAVIADALVKRGRA